MGHRFGSVKCEWAFAYPNVWTLLPAATKLGQGNVFTGVCDSVHRGGSLAGRRPPGRENPTPPGQGEPPWQGDPPGQGEPPSRETPPGQGEPPHGQGEPPSRETPPAGRPPGEGRTPRAGRTPPAYGQWAAGTHPTGMHSCLILMSKSWVWAAFSRCHYSRWLAAFLHIFSIWWLCPIFVLILCSRILIE